MKVGDCSTSLQVLSKKVYYTCELFVVDFVAIFSISLRIINQSIVTFKTKVHVKTGVVSGERL